MKLYTSYFAQLRKFPQNLVGLSTAHWNPKWRPMGKDKRGVICVDCPPFKPGRECDGLCNGSCNPKHPEDCAFLKAYKAQLDKINLTQFQNSLGKLASKISAQENIHNIDFALIVYETPSNPCSERIAIQQWGKEHNLQIEEWQSNI